VTETTWRVLVIDDIVKMTDDAKRELSDAFDGSDLIVNVEVENDFRRGYERVAAGECDIVVLDVRRDRKNGEAEDSARGRRVYSEIREARFLPVIFWTALPEDVMDDEMDPLVRVFAKDELQRIPDAIRAAIASGVVDVMANIESHVADVMRRYLWDELAPNWQEDTGGDPREVAYVLITRIASSLRAQDIPGLMDRPSHRYVYPPVSDAFESGQLLHRSRRRAGAVFDEWFVIVTPACDLKQAKADFVLLARARSLSSLARYHNWAEQGMSNSKWKELEKLLSGALQRYEYLPAFRDIPDLVVDFEDTLAVPKKSMRYYTRKASLNSPFSEALLAKHSQFLGRIGTPDLNLGPIKTRLTEAAREGR
jgi:hypothetical protein